MPEIGKKNSLRLQRTTEEACILTDKKNVEVLLPLQEAPKGIKVGELLEVFVYVNSQGDLAATTIVPLAEVGDIALLECREVNRAGAFMDWGIDKDLLVPFSEQLEEMIEGKYYPVYIFLDEKTQRPAGSTKIKKFLHNSPMLLKQGDMTEAFVFADTPMGFLAATEQHHLGMLYHNELFNKVRTGDKLTVWVKKIKENGELDLSAQKIGFDHVDDQSKAVLQYLKQMGGFIPLNDNSSPEEIRERLKMSKKVYKKAIGILFRKKIIELKADGIQLLKKKL